MYQGHNITDVPALRKDANYSFLKISGWGPPVYQSIISTVCKIGILVPLDIWVIQPIFPVNII